MMSGYCYMSFSLKLLYNHTIQSHDPHSRSHDLLDEISNGVGGLVEHGLDVP